MKTIFMVAAAISLAGSGAVSDVLAASTAGLPASKRTFAQMDSNKDGKLTVEELSPRAQKRLARYDDNKDGSVSRQEIDVVLAKILERRRDRLLKELDADKNGVITTVEVTTFVDVEFARADKDGDGGLTADEAQAYKPAPTPDVVQTEGEAPDDAQ